jgi:dihydrofolate synthase/folylpolyglutamate synthase
LDPHKRLKAIHIAGTNGKGSTARIIAQVLEEHGFKVGLYTSPHLIRVNERFVINQNEISNEELNFYLGLLKKAARGEKFTYFEITTALAFLYFVDKGVDFAVIECGMGGRLDATNVLWPEVSIITTIGLDHTKFLGDTFEKIAWEKAGIMKRNVPCVIGQVEQKALQVFKTRAQKSKVPLYMLGKDFKVEFNGEEWNYNGKRKFKGLVLSLKGFYQGNNLACALKTLEILEEKAFFKLDDGILKKALQKIKHPGRYEKIFQNGKEILMDSAHNPQGAKALAVSLEREKFVDVILIMGVSNADERKPFSKMLEPFLPLASKIFLCEFPSPRKIVSLKEWEEAISKSPTLQKFQDKIKLISHPKNAYIQALKETGRKILITGSIYFIAWFLEFFKNGQKGSSLE